MPDSVWIAGAHCPGCGADLAPGTAECTTCGFELVEAPGRELHPPSRRALVIGAAVTGALALVALVVVLLASRETAPDPVPAATAEDELETRLSSLQDDDTAAVTCPADIRPDEVTRCHVRYGLGGVQTILVRLTPEGELDVDIP